MGEATTTGLGDLNAVNKRAADKHQRIENAAAKAEGREPRNLRAEMKANRAAMRAARAQKEQA